MWVNGNWFTRWN